MSTIELKKLLVKRIKATDDESLLKAAYSILERGTKKDRPLRPMTLKELFARDAKAEKDIKAGRLIPVEEVRKRFTTKK